MKTSFTWEDIYDRLEKTYPEAKCSLDYQTPFQLLVATVLSAQTTDARVNTVTPELFRRWPTPPALAGANEDEVQSVVRPLGFQKRRAAQLIGLAQQLTDRHQAEVPPSRSELVKLPGVGRKTAHVVLGNCFGQPALTVDTHVGRLSRRLGLTEQNDPRKVEQDLAQFFPPHTWTKLGHLLIFHGRATCQAKNPDCPRCVLADLCPKKGLG